MAIKLIIKVYNEFYIIDFVIYFLKIDDSKN